MEVFSKEERELFIWSRVSCPGEVLSFRVKSSLAADRVCTHAVSLQVALQDVSPFNNILGGFPSVRLIATCAPHSEHELQMYPRSRKC